MLGWPWLRFNTFYAAFVKREISDEIQQRKIGQINALWANSNYDGKDVDRGEIIRQVEEQFDEVIKSVYSDKPEEHEIDKSNPFFSAMERGLQRLENPIDLTAQEQEGTMTDS